MCSPLGQLQALHEVSIAFRKQERKDAADVDRIGIRSVRVSTRFLVVANSRRGVYILTSTIESRATGRPAAHVNAVPRDSRMESGSLMGSISNPLGIMPSAHGEIGGLTCTHHQRYTVLISPASSPETRLDWPVDRGFWGRVGSSRGQAARDRWRVRTQPASHQAHDTTAVKIDGALRHGGGEALRRHDSCC